MTNRTLPWSSALPSSSSRSRSPSPGRRRCRARAASGRRSPSPWERSPLRRERLRHRDRRADPSLRRSAGGGRHRSARAARQLLRLSRRERRRQEHHHLHADGRARSDQRSAPGAGVARRGCPEAPHRSGSGGTALLGAPHGPGAPGLRRALLWPRPGGIGPPRRRAAGDDGAGGRCPQADRGLLLRHAQEAGAGGGPHPRSGAALPRRAVRRGGRGSQGFAHRAAVGPRPPRPAHGVPHLARPRSRRKTLRPRRRDPSRPSGRAGEPRRSRRRGSGRGLADGRVRATRRRGPGRYAWSLLPSLTAVAQSESFLDPRRFRAFPVSARLLSAINFAALLFDPVWLVLYPPLVAIALAIAALPGAPAAWAMLIAAGLAVWATASLLHFGAAFAALFDSRPLFPRLFSVALLLPGFAGFQLSLPLPPHPRA